MDELHELNEPQAQYGIKKQTVEPSEPVKTKVSLEAYLDMIADGTRRLEFHDGEVIDVQSASEAHGLIRTNFVGVLYFCLMKKGCSIYAGDREQWIEACNKMYYPDIIIVCGDHQKKQMSKNVEATINPRVVIEVLSDSTENYDLTKKSRCYQTVKGLEQIVFVWQDEKLVKTLRRMENKRDWIESYFSEEAETVPIADCEILLSEIYNGVVFPNIEGERAKKS